MGIQLEFIEFHERGKRLVSRKDNRTFAILSDIIDGRLLRSELHIIVSEKYANPSISCNGISNGTDDHDDDNKTTSFSVSSKLYANNNVLSYGLIICLHC